MGMSPRSTTGLPGLCLLPDREVLQVAAGATTQPLCPEPRPRPAPSTRLPLEQRPSHACELPIVSIK